MDEQVGKVLKALEENGLKEKTIVVFTSDHGYSMGSSGVWQKITAIEEVLKVPLIISSPGGKAQRTEQIVELIDLFLFDKGFDLEEIVVFQIHPIAFLN